MNDLILKKNKRLKIFRGAIIIYACLFLGTSNMFAIDVAVASSLNGSIVRQEDSEFISKMEAGYETPEGLIERKKERDVYEAYAKENNTLESFGDDNDGNEEALYSEVETLYQRAQELMVQKDEARANGNIEDYQKLTNDIDTVLEEMAEKASAYLQAGVPEKTYYELNSAVYIDDTYENFELAEAKVNRLESIAENGTLSPEEQIELNNARIDVAYLKKDIEQIEANIEKSKANGYPEAIEEEVEIIDVPAGNAIPDVTIPSVEVEDESISGNGNISEEIASYIGDGEGWYAFVHEESGKTYLVYGEDLGDEGFDFQVNPDGINKIILDEQGNIISVEDTEGGQDWRAGQKEQVVEGDLDFSGQGFDLDAWNSSFIEKAPDGAETVIGSSEIRVKQDAEGVYYFEFNNLTIEGTDAVLVDESEISGGLGELVSFNDEGIEVYEKDGITYVKLPNGKVFEADKNDTRPLSEQEAEQLGLESEKGGGDETEEELAVLESHLQEITEQIVTEQKSVGLSEEEIAELEKSFGGEVKDVENYTLGEIYDQSFINTLYDVYHILPEEVLELVDTKVDEETGRSYVQFKTGEAYDTYQFSYGGTTALTTFGNQIPQYLSMFGYRDDIYIDGGGRIDASKYTITTTGLIYYNPSKTTNNNRETYNRSDFHNPDNVANGTVSQEAWDAYYSGGGLDGDTETTDDAWSGAKWTDNADDGPQGGGGPPPKCSCYEMYIGIGNFGSCTPIDINGCGAEFQKIELNKKTSGVREKNAETLEKWEKENPGIPIPRELLEDPLEIYGDYLNNVAWEHQENLRIEENQRLIEQWIEEHPGEDIPSTLLNESKAEEGLEDFQLLLSCNNKGGTWYSYTQECKLNGQTIEVTPQDSISEGIAKEIACQKQGGTYIPEKDQCKLDLGRGLYKYISLTEEDLQNAAKIENLGTTTEQGTLPPQMTITASEIESKNYCQQMNGVWGASGACYPPVDIPYGDGRNLGANGYGDTDNPMVWIEGLFLDYDYQAQHPQYLSPNPITGEVGDTIEQEHHYAVGVLNDWSECENGYEWSRNVPVPVTRYRECTIQESCTKYNTETEECEASTKFASCSQLWNHREFENTTANLEGGGQYITVEDNEAYWQGYGSSPNYSATEQRFLDAEQRRRQCGTSGDGELVLAPGEDLLNLEIQSGGVFDREAATLEDEATCLQSGKMWVGGRCHDEDPGANSQAKDCSHMSSAAYWDPVLGTCIDPADKVNPEREACIDKGWIWHLNSCHDPDAQRNCEAQGCTWTANGCQCGQTTSYQTTPAQIRKSGDPAQLAILKTKRYTEVIAYLKEEKQEKTKNPFKLLAQIFNIAQADTEELSLREIHNGTKLAQSEQKTVATCPDRTGKGTQNEGYANGWNAVTCEECDAGIDGSDNCYGPQDGWQFMSKWKPTTCGDGKVQATETCDDGESFNTGTCNANCSGYTYCGDFTIQNPNGEGVGGVANDGVEECDDGPEGSDSCTPECTREGSDVLDWQEVVSD